MIYNYSMLLQYLLKPFTLKAVPGPPIISARLTPLLDIATIFFVDQNNKKDNNFNFFNFILMYNKHSMKYQYNKQNNNIMINKLSL